MPQKKNPDVAELARGKAGRLIGDLMALLTVLKGLPLAYDRDLQEDKEPVFDAVDTLLLVLPAVSGMIATMRDRHVDRLAATAADGFALATDVAEHLVRRGVPFREAHEAVGHLVVWCAVHECDLQRRLRRGPATVSQQLTPDVRDVLSVPGRSPPARRPGGTAPERVAEQLDAVAEPWWDHDEWASTLGRRRGCCRGRSTTGRCSRSRRDLLGAVVSAPAWRCG